MAQPTGTPYVSKCTCCILALFIFLTIGWYHADIMNRFKEFRRQSKHVRGSSSLTSTPAATSKDLQREKIPGITQQMV